MSPDSLIKFFLRKNLIIECTTDAPGHSKNFIGYIQWCDNYKPELLKKEIMLNAKKNLKYSDLYTEINVSID
jgi:hypothetical protein